MHKGFCLKGKGLVFQRISCKTALLHKIGLCFAIRNSFIKRSIHEEGFLNEEDVFHKKIPPRECPLVKRHLFDKTIPS
jgi:hypothetical protein